MASDPALAAAFSSTLAVLICAHWFADYWTQTDGQAKNKAEPGAAGWGANLTHVAVLTAVLTLALLGTGLALGIAYDPARLAAGLAVNAATHSWADRKSTLRRLATAIGKGEWVAKDRTALQRLDQAWHIGWLPVVALIITG